MCGICGMLICPTLSTKEKNMMLDEFYESSRKIAHRGPDRSVMITMTPPVDAVIDFKRLSIMDPSTRGDQPFRFEEGDRTVYTMCNGEIYNFRELAEEYDLKLTSGSDCEVIHLFYKKYGLMGLPEMCNKFNSEHAFAIFDVDMKTGDYKLILSSDRYGVRPLFVGWDDQGFYFASELQGLPCLESKGAYVERFKPRHYAVIEKKGGVLGKLEYHQYYEVKPKAIIYTDLPLCLEGIRSSLEKAVIMRLQSDKPYGCLLSGGLDSSLVSAIAARHLKTLGKTLRTFSIGMPGGTDGPYAKMVAEHIGSDHTHVEVSEKDFLDAIPHIVRAIGSYDITTVRASTAQYLISKWVSEKTDIRVLILGDGNDELAGAYQYFHKAPSPRAFHDECVRLVEDIHLYDGLRADRCVAHWGLEARFPCLDYMYVDFYLRCDPQLRMPVDGMEKWLLRKSFDGTGLLPEKALYRPKCAFSDGISKQERSWYQVIQEDVEKLFTTEQLEAAMKHYEHLPPVSKESLLYRTIFCDYFGSNESVAKTIPYYWLPKWCGDIKEPSARVLAHYKE